MVLFGVPPSARWCPWDKNCTRCGTSLRTANYYCDTDNVCWLYEESENGIAVVGGFNDGNDEDENKNKDNNNNDDNEDANKKKDNNNDGEDDEEGDNEIGIIRANNSYKISIDFILLLVCLIILILEI